MKINTWLFIRALFFGSLIACTRQSLAAPGSDPKVSVKITHGEKEDQNKHDRKAGLTATNTVTSSGEKNRVRWEIDNKEFSIVLPNAPEFEILTVPKGSTNSDTHFFDPKAKVVVASAGGVVELVFKNPPNKGTAKYHIAVHGSHQETTDTGAGTKAVYYNYDMMEATLSWDDISGSKDP